MMQGRLKDWLYRLQQLQAGNVLLKHRLAERIRTDPDRELLDRAESFQTQLLDKDAAIALLRHELSQQYDPGTVAPGTQGLLSDRIEQDVCEMERGQHQLATVFDDYFGAGAVS